MGLADGDGATLAQSGPGSLTDSQSDNESDMLITGHTCDDTHTHAHTRRSSPAHIEGHTHTPNGALPTVDAHRHTHEPSASVSGGGSKLAYLDGLRGVAAMSVVLSHIIPAFYPFLLSSIRTVGTTNARDYTGDKDPPPPWLIPPITLLFDGPYAVGIFFVLSGRVLLASQFRKPGLDLPSVTSAAVRRILRLGLPCIPVVVVQWLLAKMGACRSEETYNATLGTAWTSLYISKQLGELSFRRVVRFLIDVFTDNEIRYHTKAGGGYIGVLWTMRLEFRGSMMLYLLYVLSRSLATPSSRWMLYALTLAWFLQERMYYALFVLGFIMCDLEVTYASTLKHILYSPEGAAPSRRRRALTMWLWALRLLFAWLAMSAETMEAPFWPNNTSWRQLCGSVSCLALLAITPFLQRFFSSALMRFLGRISFSLYLWHTTLTYSLGSQLFMHLLHTRHTPYNTASAITIFVCISLSLAIAYAATTCIDEPCVRLATHAYKALFTPHNPSYAPHRAIASVQRYLWSLGRKALLLLPLPRHTPYVTAVNGHAHEESLDDVEMVPPRSSGNVVAAASGQELELLLQEDPTSRTPSSPSATTQPTHTYHSLRGLAALLLTLSSTISALPRKNRPNWIDPFFIWDLCSGVMLVVTGRTLLESQYRRWDHLSLTKSVCTRVVHIWVPCVVMLVATWLLANMGLFWANQAKALTGSGAWEAIYLDPELQKVPFADVWGFLVDIPTFNDVGWLSYINGKYAGPLWLVRFDIRGSFMLYLLMVLVHTVPSVSRWMLYAAATWWCTQERPQYCLLVFGMAICDLDVTHGTRWRQQIQGMLSASRDAPRRTKTNTRVAWAVVAFFRLWLIYIIATVNHVSIPWWPSPLTLQPSASLLVLLIATWPSVHHALSTWPTLRLLGRVSWSLWLWHQTVLLTFGGWLMCLLAAQPAKSATPRTLKQPAGLLAVTYVCVNVCVSVGVAYGATVLVEDPCKRAVDWMYRRLFEANR